jgi:hypothetical protein
MNLGEIRDQIAFILDYDPDNTDYTDDLNDLINRNYLDLFGREDFSFAQKEKPIVAHKTVSATSVSVTNGSALVTTGTSFFIAEQMEGMTISIEEVEYTIAWIKSGTQAYLTMNYAGSTTTNATIKVEHRYIDLPDDCVRILDVFRRQPDNPEQMLPLSRSDEGFYSIDFTETGEPIRWLPIDDFTIRSPRNNSFVAVTSGSGHGVRTLEFATTFTIFNKESSFAKITELELSNTQIMRWTFPSLPNTSGRIYHVYCRNKAYSYKWFKVPENSVGRTEFVPDVGGSYDFTLPNSVWTDTFELTYSVAPENGGHYKRFRLYPMQDNKYTIYVRYCYRPKVLRDDEDSPEFDSAYHKILVFMSAREAFAKANNASMAGMYASKVKNEYQKLSNSFLSQRQQRWIRRNGSFSQVRRTSKLVTGDFGTLP